MFHAHFVTQSTNGRTFLPPCATGGTVAAVSRAWPVILLLLALASGVQAHPSIENGMQIVVARQHVTLEARVSLDEVDIAHEIPSAGGPNIDMAKLGDVLRTQPSERTTPRGSRSGGWLTPTSSTERPSF